ncbi:MAG: zinc-binding dehydrogenase, partial [Micrococcales bacterium]|nr:zinc-binding dehydrogenase [Micrococcales bacterium]
LADNLAMLATGGRLVVIGMQKGRRGTLDLGLLLERRASVIGTTLRSRPLDERVAIVTAVRERVWPLVEQGRVQPVVHTRLPLAQAPQAHRLLASGEVLGKVVLTA